MQYFRLFMLARWLLRRRFWLSGIVMLEGAFKMYRRYKNKSQFKN